MSTLDRINTDLKDAMRERDSLRLTALRSVLASITVASKAGKSQSVLSEDEVLAVIGREVKKRVEARDIYRASGHEDKADVEEAERNVISVYLPQQLTEAELVSAVEGVLAGIDTPTQKHMGVIIKEVKAKYGAAVDGKALSQLVKSRLG